MRRRAITAKRKVVPPARVLHHWKYVYIELWYYTRPWFIYIPGPIRVGNTIYWHGALKLQPNPRVQFLPQNNKIYIKLRVQGNGISVTQEVLCPYPLTDSITWYFDGFFHYPISDWVGGGGISGITWDSPYDWPVSFQSITPWYQGVPPEQTLSTGYVNAGDSGITLQGDDNLASDKDTYPRYWIEWPNCAQHPDVFDEGVITEGGI